MSQAGEQRPRGGPVPAAPRRASGFGRLRPGSLPLALVAALLVALLSALAWALIKGILEFHGVLAVAVVGGWAMGALLRPVRVRPIVAAVVAVLAWLLGLLLTWLLAMAMLPGSSRTFLQRLEGTPFLDWLAPQAGLIEVLGLLLYVVAALYGARPRSSWQRRS